MGEASAVDENDDGATIAAVTTENSSEVTVDNDYFEVADGNLKLKDGMSLDFESVEGGMIELTLTASGDGESATAMVTVTVNDVNEAPMIEVADGETPDGMAASSTVDENVTGALLGAITLSDPDAGQMHTLSTSDARFITKQDGEGGWWLALADDASLNYEDGATVTVTVTVMDDGDPSMSASTDVTITVNDVNEAPDVVGEVADITTESGDPIETDPIDLLALFNDPDAGDANAVRYTLSGQPSWLTFSVEYGEDEDGNDTVHGIFTGMPPVTGPDSDAAHMVTLTATDSDGAEGSVSFYVIVDDGNDRITDIILNHNPDDDGNEARNVNYVVDVDENDASGVVFGRIIIEDQDHPMHPNGTHMVTVDDEDRFEIKVDAEGGLWLALKAGVALDHEKEDGFVTVKIKAVDMNGEKDARGNYKGYDLESPTITVNINDVNEAPKANTIGNWWVTVNNALLESSVTEGSWLKFGLDTEAPGAAFTDPEGDDLEYSISGPSWIQIDEDGGTITNKAEMTPNPGAYRLSVTATDPDGLSDTATFTLYVAESAVVGGDANVGNRQPTISLTTGSSQYTEGSGDRRIATIRAEDDDQNLAGHPFAISKVEIVSVVNLGDNADTNNVADATAEGAMNTGFAAAFRLSDPVKSGNTLTYGLHVMDTNQSPMTDTTDVLDYEGGTSGVLNVRLVVRVTDGAGKSSDVTVDVRINDANEAPEVVTANAPTATNLTVEQSQDAGGLVSDGTKSLVWINLNDMWEDPDIGDVDATLTFRASTSTSWIKILHGPDRWDTISRGPDGILGGDNAADDVTWGGTGTPDASDYVVVVELDRTERNNDQDASGSFTITATDDGGATGTYTGRVTVTDENLAVGANAVSITGGSNPREGGRLTPRFNEARDPDLAGSDSAALVIYTWSTLDPDAEGDPNEGSASVFAVTTSDAPLTLTQDHVGDFIRVSVSYYEVFEGAFTAAQAGGSATTSKVVADSQDRGSANINIFAADTGADGTVTSGEMLRAEVNISDPDGIPDADGDGNDDITYTWQVSDNGRGGWTDVAEPDPDTSTDVNEALEDTTLTLANGDGKYYRLVATYTDDAGGSERHASQAVHISDLPAAARSAPTVTGSTNPGGTLSVNASGATVQWQKMMMGSWVDIPGATGDLSLTASDAGSQVRAVVTYPGTSSQPEGATAIVATAAQTIGVAPAPIAPVTVKANHYIEASVDVAHAAVSGRAPGKTATIEETVDLRSLFQDPDSARLTYTVTSALGSDEATGDDNTLQITSAGGVLTFEERSGKLTYVSDVTHDHDGTTTGDGDGNMITLAVAAADGTGTANANVHLRINVAPTDITFGTPTPSIEENGRGNEELVTTLDVQDQNQSGDSSASPIALPHKFGSHTITVSDDRFVVTNSDNGRTDGDGDASTWDLRIKKGATFDVETDDMDEDTDGTQIILTFTATDGGGLSTPVPIPGPNGNGYTAITLVVTITDDPNEVDPPRPSPTDVPGLQDDENNDPDNELVDDESTVDTDHDGDNDGGSQPPPPGMSLGGIIEDFVDNMDGFEQDLLEDFLLKIDDGLDMV